MSPTVRLTAVRPDKTARVLGEPDATTTTEQTFTAETTARAYKQASDFLEGFLGGDKETTILDFSLELVDGDLPDPEAE